MLEIGRPRLVHLPSRMTARYVRGALARQAVWDLGNQVLYDFCRKNPHHQDTDAIIGKVWLIGRSYAAAIGRRQGGREVAGDDFYLDVVAPEMRHSGIDQWGAADRELRRPDAGAVVPVHARLTQLFEKISGQQKRALASKYLHFHFPRAVYIFDDRANRAVRRLTANRRTQTLPYDRFDAAYARFFTRVSDLHNELEQLLGRRVSPREVDKVLLDVANSEWFWRVHSCCRPNFPGRDDRPGRTGFVGREGPEEFARLYVGKRVPDEYRKKGAANPIKYTW